MSLVLPRRAITSLGLLGLGAAVFGRPAFAALPALSGRPILTITGKIRVFNDEQTAKFDLPGLESLGVTSFTTTTRWHRDAVKFEGVRMDHLMEAVGAYGTMVTATALNDYVTQIPVEDFARHKPILALKKNGEYMPTKDKGPLFIVYPFDSDPALHNQTFYSRSAWSLASLQVS